MPSPSPTTPNIDDIRAAAARIEPYAVRTPLLESPHLNDAVGGRVLIKAEPLQRTGSFKFRGAFNAVSQIPENKIKNGVVAFSSGNHAQGVAAAAGLLGMPAVIVMPEDAPALKIENTRGFGAEVINYDRYTDDREAIGAKISAERGATLIKPYDDPKIIAGQGTLGLEIVEQIDTAPDLVLGPCGGGGLISGTAIAVTEAFPNAQVFAVEPEDFDDTARSLKQGKRQEIDPDARSICDALLPTTPGELTFAINLALLAGGLVVSDAQVKEAMRQAFLRLKLVVEPGGVVALAAALSGAVDCRDKVTVCICSGGNVDPNFFADVLRGE
ncbi:MAG: threonine/serine dehydratase [Rhodospirillaceae bacterium]|nr:threonine/serine dehydratase [Rhodospirillaceae bacterium]